GLSDTRWRSHKPLRLPSEASGPKRAQRFPSTSRALRPSPRAPASIARTGASMLGPDSATRLVQREGRGALRAPHLARDRRQAPDCGGNPPVPPEASRPPETLLGRWTVL